MITSLLETKLCNVERRDDHNNSPDITVYALLREGGGDHKPPKHNTL
jgi:hypothetical protein